MVLEEVFEFFGSWYFEKPLLFYFIQNLIFLSCIFIDCCSIIILM